MTARRALWGLMAVAAALHLAWAAAIGLGNDEAYHYLFTVHRDWSYFDHPPMLAWVESLGILAAGGHVSPFTLRLGFVALFAGSTWLMARLTERFYGATAGVFAALALNLTAYHALAASTFALPDGPLLFFWLLTLERLAAALDAQAQRLGPLGFGRWAAFGRARLLPSRRPNGAPFQGEARQEPRPPGENETALGPWVAVGLAWGGALLSKYHAVFLPAGAVLYLLIHRPARVWLRRPGPYVAVAVGVLLFSPVIAWNAAHHWASFAFQGGRALGTWRLQPQSLALYLVGQMAYLCPWIWLHLVVLLARSVRGRRDGFLVCQAVMPLALFTGVASFRDVLPHWTLVAFLALFPLLGRAWAQSWNARPQRLARRIALMAAVPVLVGLMAVVEVRTGFLQRGRAGGVGLFTADRDPTIDMVGWDQVGAELKRRGLLDRPGTFVFTHAWFHSGHLGFALRGTATPVLCYNPYDARSFAFWSRPGDWVGDDGILVSVNDPLNEPGGYARWFERIEPLGEFAVRRGGVAVRTIRLFRCVRQLRPFPFDYQGALANVARRAEPERFR